ncbi:GNAT family N-acetyltransferase [Shewanella sp. VB17]|uniref:GNAT family N-acetyltransferase n=1 Tax=Shewanella sp. VB17 TaxID=2739432 RepID=UPI00156698CC|nr:GNAT family N-acetyltransferase [Shewanella sp. VB17]NRD74708.1 GNAT family N-acetyltransferase [Shewanella sp. VB17]
MVEVITRDFLSEKLKNLTWNIFFESKGRGINFERHFPWVQLESTYWTVEAVEAECILGGLIVREIEIFNGDEIELVGCISLVCVLPLYRGKGIVNRLFKKVIELANKKKYAALTLWTNQHYLYEKKGFIVYDQSVYGTATSPEQVYNSQINEYICEALPSHVGLPPFATSGNNYSSNESSVSIIWDNKGGIVVDWSGSDKEVCCLITNILPNTFRINAHHGCSLIEQMYVDGFSIEVKPVNLQMWLKLKNCIDISKIEAAGDFKILNRI